MRRRLVVVIVGAVASALLLAALGTLALAEVGARRYTEEELRREVVDIAESLSADRRLVDELAARPGLLAVLRSALRLEGVGLVTLVPAGEVEGSLPDGVELRPAELLALRAGETVSGQRGELVWAADVIERASSRTLLVLSDRSSVDLGGSGVWFGVAAAVVVVLAVLVALQLAQRLTVPLRLVEETSRRLADGDLAARVPTPPANRHDEPAELARSVNAMAAALERSRGLEHQFLLSVSHDLRTPLTAVRGYAEALIDGTASDPVTAGEAIRTASQRLERLVQDLLELARLDARHFSLTHEAVDLHEVALGCVEGFVPEAATAGIAVGVTGSPATVAGDPDRLAQVVANLVENALRFARTRVEVAVSAAAGHARVTVDDDGPGIPEDDLPHVFERLYVASRQPVRRERPSGLGLAIVRELVTAMGGTVGAEPASIGGARLWIDLPLPSPDAAADGPTLQG